MVILGQASQACDSMWFPTRHYMPGEEWPFAQHSAVERNPAQRETPDPESLDMIENSQLTESSVIDTSRPTAEQLATNRW